MATRAGLEGGWTYYCYGGVKYTGCGPRERRLRDSAFTGGSDEEGVPVIGFVLPYYFLVSFLSANGLDLQLFFRQLFASPISSFFALDLIISAIIFWVFLYGQSQEYQMRNWWVYIVATLEEARQADRRVGHCHVTGGRGVRAVSPGSRPVQGRARLFGGPLGAAGFQMVPR